MSLEFNVLFKWHKTLDGASFDESVTEVLNRRGNSGHLGFF